MTIGGDSPGRSNNGPPLLSIVIPVWNVERYLTSCLDSILEQPFRDLEVVAVEGASTDASGAVLDKRETLDRRLKVTHLTPFPGHNRVGPGRARNEGLKRAQGDYIWFADGDDAIRPGCLTAIASRLIRDNPDVLFVGHELVFEEGDSERTEPGHDQHLLRPEGTSFTLADRPAVTGLSMASWNKIVRREFLLSTGEQFLEEWPHEDIPVSCAELVNARSIGTLDLVCYRYRQDRTGSAMMIGGSARHFNVFAAWQIALERARSSSDAVYAALFERSAWHLTNIFDKGSMALRGLAPRYVSSREDRRRFFARMQDHYLKYKPSGYSRPRGFRGVKFTLVENGAYRGYLVLAQLNSLRLRANRIRRRG